ncbi:hypothetical protein [Aneurinibacillus aneurinilyticus]|uniref:hypothetical protein n=1 Tax=Aneurinibacillus aneurinilyticus TaxID=1391 RepID=UPI0035269B42
MICKSCVNSGISINGEFCVCPAGKKLKEESVPEQELKKIRKRLEAVRTRDDIQRFGTKEHMLYVIRKLLETAERLQREKQSLEVAYTTMCDLHPEDKQHVETIREAFIEHVTIKE